MLLLSNVRAVCDITIESHAGGAAAVVDTNVLSTLSLMLNLFVVVALNEVIPEIV